MPTSVWIFVLDYGLISFVQASAGKRPWKRRRVGPTAAVKRNELGGYTAPGHLTHPHTCTIDTAQIPRAAHVSPSARASSSCSWESIPAPRRELEGTFFLPSLCAKMFLAFAVA